MPVTPITRLAKITTHFFICIIVPERRLSTFHHEATRSGSLPTKTYIRILSAEPSHTFCLNTCSQCCVWCRQPPRCIRIPSQNLQTGQQTFLAHNPPNRIMQYRLSPSLCWYSIPAHLQDSVQAPHYELKSPVSELSCFSLRAMT